jgi:Arc/MetJ family transcription regulator
LVAPILAEKVVCHTDGIRTTLDIDDDLMATLLARLPGRSKTEAIEFAIGSFLSSDAVGRLKSLAGTLEIEDLSRQLRRVDRST